MSVAADVFDSLAILNCSFFVESQPENGHLENVPFSRIVSWLSIQLQSLLNLEAKVHNFENDDDFSLFEMEFNEFVRELCPPFPLMIKSEEERLKTLHYLCGELFAARLMNKKKNAVEIRETETAKDLKTVVKFLQLGKPPENITSQQLFRKVGDILNEKIRSKQLIVEEPFLLRKGMTLSSNHWDALKKLESLLSHDYSIRRKTLLTRCDCTVGSFKWKYSNDNDMQAQIELVYNALCSKLSPDSPVTIAHALASRESDCDMLLNSMVSRNHQQCVITAPSMKSQANIGKQQRLSLHKFVIGNVPDRGGRPCEQPPPVTETFQEQQRAREQQQQRGGHSQRGSRGGNTGGHYQQSSGHNQQSSGTYQQSSGAYQQPSGYYQQSSGHHQRSGGHFQQNTNMSRVQGTGWNQNNYGGDQRYSATYDYQSNYQDNYNSGNQGYYQSDYNYSCGRGSSRRGNRY